MVYPRQHGTCVRARPVKTDVPANKRQDSGRFDRSWALSGTKIFVWLLGLVAGKKAEATNSAQINPHLSPRGSFAVRFADCSCAMRGFVAWHLFKSAGEESIHGNRVAPAPVRCTANDADQQITNHVVDDRILLLEAAVGVFAGDVGKWLRQISALVIVHARNVLEARNLTGILESLLPVHRRAVFLGDAAGKIVAATGVELHDQAALGVHLRADARRMRYGRVGAHRVGCRRPHIPFVYPGRWWTLHLGTPDRKVLDAIVGARNAFGEIRSAGVKVGLRLHVHAAAVYAES